LAKGGGVASSFPGAVPARLIAAMNMMGRHPTPGGMTVKRTVEDQPDVYLDNAATTRVRPDVVAAVVRCMESVYGNPSSLHEKGVEAERALEDAREVVARALGAKPSELIFTSGGTEANNLALKGVARAYRRRAAHVVASAIEHPSVVNAVESLREEGFSTTLVGVDAEGFVDLEGLRSAVGPETSIVSVMYVNNEVGSIQPIAEIAAILEEVRSRSRARGLPLLHVDAVQAFGRLDVDVERQGIDLLTLSGHKIGGPKGVGALYVRDGVRVEPVLDGGGQEGGLRPGTENVPGAVGLAEAARLALEERDRNCARMRALKERFAQAVLDSLHDVKVNGPLDDRGAAHILNLSPAGVRGEMLVHHLAASRVYLSTGSACSSRKPVPSHVLIAMGLTEEEAVSAVRISLSPETTGEEIDFAAERFLEAVRELRSLDLG